MYVNGYRMWLCEVDALVYVGFCWVCRVEVAAESAVGDRCKGCATAASPSPGPDESAVIAQRTNAVAAMRRLNAAIAKDVKQPPPEWKQITGTMPLSSAVELIDGLLVEYKKQPSVDWHALFHLLSLRIIACLKKKPK